MIDYNEINEEIQRLECGSTTYANMEKLAMLYTVADRHKPVYPLQKSEYSYDSAPASEFVKAVKNAPIDGVLTVLDEHMNAIMALYPKEYNAVLSKIMKLSDIPLS